MRYPICIHLRLLWKAAAATKPRKRHWLLTTELSSDCDWHVIEPISNSRDWGGAPAKSQVIEPCRGALPFLFNPIRIISKKFGFLDVYNANYYLVIPCYTNLHLHSLLKFVEWTLLSSGGQETPPKDGQVGQMDKLDTWKRKVWMSETRVI